MKREEFLVRWGNLQPFCRKVEAKFGETGFLSEIAKCSEFFSMTAK